MGNSTAYPGRDAAAEDATNIRTADLKNGVDAKRARFLKQLRQFRLGFAP